jgi:uncharacterized LabA/DUF88 family protein
MAVDLLEDSADSDIGTMVLVSSDNDLLPAVNAVTAKDKKIVYVGFSDNLTKSLVTATTETQVLRDAEIIEAFEDANPEQLALK